ncbi:MAG: hypothetical protein CMJ20_03875 [Phycisphaeraceae bacterium]|nr:hypothetical protein [Phycisphaeraceae bacterium]
MKSNYLQFRDIAISFAVLFVLLVVPVSAQLATEVPSKPNVILIVIDDLGWKDLAFMGNEFAETPNIDRLASEGVVFTNAYANAPNCAPSRASLLSGQYTPRHEIYTVTTSYRCEAKDRQLISTPTKDFLGRSVVTMAEAVKSNGYVSAAMGKWHLGNDPRFGPSGQGFNFNLGGSSAGLPASYFSPYKNPYIKDGAPGEYLTDRLTGEALRFMTGQQAGNHPFLLYLSHYALHVPLMAKQELVEKYQKKSPDRSKASVVYAAMIESVDQGVGQIMVKLKELGITQNTVIIFTSDNGGHGGVTSMSPLRGAKGTLYEGGIRVPLIVHWPGRLNGGVVIDTPVIGTDLYPTILEITGSDRPSDHVLDGKSLMSLLTNSGTFEREAIFWHFPVYINSHPGMNKPWLTTPAAAVRRGNWKLIEYFEPNRDAELYNLESDISEQHNLIEVETQVAKDLFDLMVEWRKSIDAPVPTEPNLLYEAAAVDARDLNIR